MKYLPQFSLVIVILIAIITYIFLIRPLNKDRQIYQMSIDCYTIEGKKWLPKYLEQHCKAAHEKASELREESERVDINDLEERLLKAY